MCRLLGYVSHQPVSLDAVLGGRRDDFFNLARQHGDGWGVALGDDDGLHLQKEPGSALTSPELADLSARSSARAGLAHLRWATLHLAVRPENTHPFTDGEIAFAHNGSVSPPGALDALIAPELADQRLGTTDSERYFLALRSRMRHRDVGAALAQTVEDVVLSGASVHSLNALLLTPTHLYAVCSYDPASYADPDYYPLMYRRVGDTVAVTSTGWAEGPGWSTLENGRMLVIDRATLELTVVPVARPVRHDVVAAG